MVTLTDDDEEEDDEVESLTVARASAVSWRVRNSSSTWPIRICCCDSMCVSSLSETFDDANNEDDEDDDDDDEDEEEDAEEVRVPVTSSAESRNRAI